MPLRPPSSTWEVPGTVNEMLRLLDTFAQRREHWLKVGAQDLQGQRPEAIRMTRTGMAALRLLVEQKLRCCCTAMV